jgi:hypothetical protein
LLNPFELKEKCFCITSFPSYHKKGYKLFLKKKMISWSVIALLGDVSTLLITKFGVAFGICNFISLGWGICTRRSTSKILKNLCTKKPWQVLLCIEKQRKKNNKEEERTRESQEIIEKKNKEKRNEKKKRK